MIKCVNKIANIIFGLKPYSYLANNPSLKAGVKNIKYIKGL
jgi:hypothetical protein